MSVTYLTHELLNLDVKLIAYSDLGIDSLPHLGNRNSLTRL